MTRRRRSPRQQRRFVVRGVQRAPVDLRKLGRALIALAQAEAERKAAEQRQGDGECQDGQPQG